MPIDPITHPLLPVRHGFFTRQGGVSDGIYATLNCGRGSHDMAEAVAQNRQRVARVMGAPLVGVHQVHSADVVTLHDRADIDRLSQVRADGLVTALDGVALSVLTADCQPILFADAEAGVIGAAHAGWKGALSGVIEATVEAMRTLGARKIRAVIGPCISLRAYEVGFDFMDNFLADAPEAERFFAGGPNGRPMFNLPGFGLSRLDAAGVEAEWCGHCTFSDEERFFSYRRTTHRGEGDYGRQISAITL